MRYLFPLLLLIAFPAFAQEDMFDPIPDFTEGDVVVVTADVSIPGTAAYTGTVKLLGLQCVECGIPEPVLWMGLTSTGKAAIQRVGIARTDVLPTHSNVFDRTKVVKVTWLVGISSAAVRTVVWFDGAIVFDATMETLLDPVAAIDAGAVLDFNALSYNEVIGPPAVSSGPQPIAANIVWVEL